MNELITSNLIGTRSALSTLTALYTGNQTNAIDIRHFSTLNLPVHYLAGATNQYAEVLVEVSIKDTTPSSDSDWEVYSTTLAAATENQLLDNPFIVPGDKVSTTTTTEKRTLAIDVTARWLRVSVREKTNAGATPSSFGTIFVGFSGKEELN